MIVWWPNVSTKVMARMKEETEKLSIIRVTEQGRSQHKDVMVREFPLAIIPNNHELVTFSCSPLNLKHLAVGFSSTPTSGD